MQTEKKIFDYYRFLERLQSDPEFRYGFELEPDKLLREYSLPDEFRRLLATREQIHWFSSEAGPKMLALLTLPMIIPMIFNFRGIQGEKKLSEIVEIEIE